MMKTTKSNTLKEILDISGGEEILRKNGVPCITCPLAASEINSLKLDQVSKIYQLNLSKILKELNNINISRPALTNSGRQARDKMRRDK